MIWSRQQNERKNENNQKTYYKYSCNLPITILTRQKKILTLVSCIICFEAPF